MTPKKDALEAFVAYADSYNKGSVHAEGCSGAFLRSHFSYY
jgi:hypothetical protein